MEELAFIIPDLDISPIENYLNQHVNHALEILSDPDISITDVISKNELYRLNEAVKQLDILEEVYTNWQLYRKSARESFCWILQEMEKFEKEIRSGERT